ncbi:hypothetical protein PDE_04655 [Penicillium oxalicum 114-2]|uniref:Antifungal protein n=1 Tax=Penicillium oxalicum (strain 114-2 / CGMCC 5302) TaxID=933388 RepID=S7ZG83_PENO1|nr:hypothetical protein PDE_04655 [Penicillium oxalicum 114-2]
MKLSYLSAGLLLGITTAVASPAEEPKTNLPRAGHYSYGKCNGTSCRSGFSNWKCDYGKCTKQSGGGDGKTCFNLDGKVHCPGKK